MFPFWQLDFAVLKYKNQKLAEQLEVHKFEFRALESRFNDLKEKQKTHNETLVLVKSYWERVSCSNLPHVTVTYIYIIGFLLKFPDPNSS
jgi:hypothetical protein